MLDAFRDLYSSKKFQTLIIGLLIAGGARFGLNLDPATCAAILGFFGILIHAQGNADHGKEAAQIAADAALAAAAPPANDNASLAPAAKTAQAGFAAIELMLAFAAVFFVIFGLAACNASTRQKTINATFTSTNLAGTELEAYSHDHERAILDSATSGATPIPEAKVSVAAFRAKVDHAEKTLAAVYKAIAAAALLNDEHTLAAMVQVAVLFMGELRDLGVVQ